MMKWYSHGPNNIGTYLEFGASQTATIDYVEKDAGFLRRYSDARTGEPYDVVGLFGFGGDDLARKTGVQPPPPIPGVPGLHKVISSPYTAHFHVLAQRLSNVRRQLVVSNQLDFFKD